MSERIRLVSMDDAPQLATLYNYYIEETVISFETETLSINEMEDRIRSIATRYPWYVIEKDGTVLAYAYACQHRSRAAYRWAVEVTVYVQKGAGRQGLGRRLYEILLNHLSQLGFTNAFAGIALPNAASVGLHERMGFREIGVYRKVGYKLGAWHDVGWWQKSLNDSDDTSEPRFFDCLNE